MAATILVVEKGDSCGAISESHAFPEIPKFSIPSTTRMWKPPPNFFAGKTKIHRMMSRPFSGRDFFHQSRSVSEEFPAELAERFTYRYVFSRGQKTLVLYRFLGNEKLPMLYVDVPDL